MSFAQESEMSREAWANCIRYSLAVVPPPPRSWTAAPTTGDQGIVRRAHRDRTIQHQLDDQKSYQAITGLFILKIKPVSNGGSLWGFALIG
jgi:hypothetical protein